ncbi:MAG: hypothetical protein IJH87_00140, partial [Atopobiaceae bacterium]|nr:hypothetical protein [Atopobiaceae bacterium]
RLLELVLEHQTMEKVYGSPVREAAKTPSSFKGAPAHSGEEPAHLMEEPVPTAEPHHLEEEPAHLEAAPAHAEDAPAHTEDAPAHLVEEPASIDSEEEPAPVDEEPAAGEEEIADHTEEPLPAHSPEAIAEAIAEAESAGEELPADGVVALARVGEPSTQALMLPKHAAPEAKHLSAGDVGCVLLAVLVSTLLVPRPALAYVDPSVMTYAIQALAAVAVALSAVLGVAFRKTRSVILKLLRIDEKSGDLSEPPVHRIDPAQKDEIDWEVREGRKTREIERKKRQVRVAWPIRLLLSALAVGLIAFTVFMVAPIELVASNSSSLVYGVDMVWKPLAVRAAIITGVGALVLSLFRGKPFHFLLALVTALGVAAYLEAFIFARYLPIADGTPVNWSAFGVVTALSLALWIVVIIGSIVFSFRKSPVARTIGAIAAVVLISMQSAGLASLSGITGAGEDVIREDEGPEITAENYQNVCTELGLFDVSSQNNVIVFVLDMTDSSYIRYLL